MKARIAILAALLVGGFVLATNWKQWDLVSRFARNTEGPLWSGPSVAQGAGLSTDEQNNIEIYRRAHAATVNVTSTVYRQNWFLQIYPSRESGSGFFIDKAGRILTNNHVVSGRSPEVNVTLANGQKYKASVVYRDPNNDLAMLKIQPKGEISYLPMGDSEKLQVGQKVLAIGNPFGLDGTLTTGIVSSLGRDIADETGRKLEGMIQTDAAINPGNSGGPLLDSSGSVIAINTAIYGPGGNIGIGFAMPINRAKTMIEDYQSNKTYGRPRLGVDVMHVYGDLAVELGLPAEGGLLVQGVAEGSAAEAAGVRRPRQILVVGNAEIGIGGDLIMAIDGQNVDRLDALSRALARKRPGDKVELTLFRNRRQVKLTVTLGEAQEKL
ncbi:MAG: trypsin-like peptidase domain-containing protein [Candidatus Solibacter usitatus]|nr:trypsin-like peptidase domain-containing protein [Candidatus Solibacter usitatus]